MANFEITDWVRTEDGIGQIVSVLSDGVILVALSNGVFEYSSHKAVAVDLTEEEINQRLFEGAE